MVDDGGSKVERTTSLQSMGKVNRLFGSRNGGNEIRRTRVACKKFLETEGAGKNRTDRIGESDAK